ncbi:MAG TPA: hypothetical protein DEB53_03360 [Bacillus pumilus]|nr:hypothetical protein [Bacillus pumilus]
MMHVLKDEKLGVDREYVAVDRDAEVGEKIIVIDSPIYPKGHVSDVIKLGRFSEVYADGSCYLAEGVDGDNYIEGMCEHYHVLEPTDIVHIDGERYRLEDRKAEVGERVLYVDKESGDSDGVAAKVTSSGIGSVDVSEYLDTTGETVCGFSHGYYYVLTPVQADTEPKESDVITVLANLGAEVAELKRTVARHQAEINSLHEDKVRLGEQLAKVTADVGGKTELSGTFIADVIIGLKRAGL